MTNNFSDMLTPYSDLLDSDLIELLTDKVSEFFLLSPEQMQYADDNTVFLEVPEGYSIDINGITFFEDSGVLSYMKGEEEVTPLYLDLQNIYPSWEIYAAGISGLRSVNYVFGVFCRVLSDLNEDYGYMEIQEDVNALCWALADFYDIEH